MKKQRPKDLPAGALPTYAALADLVAELTEINIANLDCQDARFVTCFTYGPKVMPPHWQRAIDAREALIQNRAIARQNRHGSSKKKPLSLGARDIKADGTWPR